MRLLRTKHRARSWYANDKNTLEADVLRRLGIVLNVAIAVLLAVFATANPPSNGFEVFLLGIVYGLLILSVGTALRAE